MMSAQSQVDAGIWTVPGHDLSIEYSRLVLSGILTEVVDAFDAYLSGGFEVGGVLLGRFENNRVHILAHRPLQIRPPRPSFVLSGQDEKQLEELLRSAPAETALTGMVPVGWYHSHTRSEIFLSESDMEIYDRFFPHPWQVAMVLHPSELEPVRVGFFFRESDGFVRTDQSYQEFAVEPPPRPLRLKKMPPWEGGAAPPPAGAEPADLEIEEDAAPVLAAVSPELYSLPPEPEKPSPWRRLAGWGLLAAAGLAITAGSASIYWMRQPEAPFGLELAPLDNDLRIIWNPTSRVLQDAREVKLRITDGTHQSELPVVMRIGDTAERRYTPRSSRVDVRLIAVSSFGRVRQEGATYVVHPNLGKPSPALVAARQAAAEAERESETLRGAVAARIEQNNRLEAAISALEQEQQQRIEARQRRTEQVQQRAQSRPPAKRAATELPAAPEIASRAPAGSPLPPMPAGEWVLRPPPEPPRPVRTAPTPVATVTAAPPLAVSPPKPGYTGPLSGRLVWTGELPKDTVLTIEGKKASTGFVSGELPPVPVRVGAYPAELQGNGIRVLTGNPKYGQPKQEAAGAANAWNATQYVYDPKSLRDVIVEQMPAPSNPRRMTLRAGGRKLHMIVIDWQVIAQ